MKFQLKYKNIDIFIYTIYRSPRAPISKFKTYLTTLKHEFDTNRNVICIGDFNSCENLLADYGFQESVIGRTTAGLHGNQLCHAYTKLQDFNISGYILMKSFSKSFHHPISILLNLK